MNQISLLLIISSTVLVFAGLLLSGNLGPLGRLPGDIRFNRPGFTFCFPLTTSLLISLALTALLWLVQKLWR